MLNLRKLLAASLCGIICAAAMTGCGDDESGKKKDSGTSAAAPAAEVDKTAEENADGSADDADFTNEDGSADDADFTNGDSSIADEGTETIHTANSGSTEADNGSIVNFTAPKKGEDILVLKIKDYGEIKIKLFPEEAEKGVENIKGLCERNYYDGLIFHRIINDFMIQGGDPTGTGMGGESIWGEKFDGGTNNKLVHAAGAIAYANSGSTATNGSQFYIVTGTKYDAATLQAYGIELSEEAQKIYAEDGGAPWLDGGYTVFGQVFDGLDVVFRVQGVQTAEGDRPVKDVVIESMRVEKYDGSPVRFHLSDY